MNSQGIKIVKIQNLKRVKLGKSVFNKLINKSIQNTKVITSVS